MIITDHPCGYMPPWTSKIWIWINFLRQTAIKTYFIITAFNMTLKTTTWLKLDKTWFSCISFLLWDNLKINVMLLMTTNIFVFKVSNAEISKQNRKKIRMTWFFVHVQIKVIIHFYLMSNYSHFNKKNHLDSSLWPEKTWKIKKYDPINFTPSK